VNKIICIGCDRFFEPVGDQHDLIFGLPACPTCARKWVVLEKALEPLGGLVAKDEGTPQ
jgi:hypothetical protein